MVENARAPDQTSLRIGTPAGSLRYFAVLFADAERRDTLHAHYALEYALRSRRGDLGRGHGLYRQAG